MAAATGKTYAQYGVEFIDHLGRRQTSVVSLISNYTTFEDIRKILAMRLTGNTETAKVIVIRSAVLLDPDTKEPVE